MAIEEHLKILKQGVDVWNRWREENPDIQPDLSGADLSWSNLQRVNFRGASLSWADFSLTALSEANLSEAALNWAKFVNTDLNGANLTSAELTGAIFVSTGLQGSDLSYAKIGYTTFVHIDLRRTKGLDNVAHAGPSSVGVDTFYHSRGEIPEGFLRGAGVPDSMIEFACSLATSEKAIDFYSCFISYSSRDQAFVERLHADLQDKGVRCWFAPEDMKIGDKIRPALDQSIRVHDKLLIILSENSVESNWVEQEVETALARERQEKRTVLFPIRLDDAVMGIDEGWPALIRNTRHIGDFQNWKDHDAYQQAFGRLLRDLKAG